MKYKLILNDLLSIPDSVLNEINSDLKIKEN